MLPIKPIKHIDSINILTTWQILYIIAFKNQQIYRLIKNCSKTIEIAVRFLFFCQGPPQRLNRTFNKIPPPWVVIHWWFYCDFVHTTVLFPCHTHCLPSRFLPLGRNVTAYSSVIYSNSPPWTKILNSK